MKNLLPRCWFPLAVLLGLAGPSALAQTTYNQALTNAFATGTNLVEKSATTAPNDTITFSNAVKSAYATNSGGVFDFPSAVATGTTLFRGTYSGGSNRLHITSSASMQNSTSGGNTFYPISNPNVATSSANNADYTLTFSGIYDVATSNLLTSQSVYCIGFIVLSRTDPGYPLDVRTTVTFNDGSTQAVTSAIGNPRGSDDTFFGFTAPDNLAIISVRLQSFATGTSTPVANRIAFDDFGFLTRLTAILPQPVVENLNPTNYAVVSPTNNLQFNVRSYVSLDPANIIVTLNASNLAGTLTITGNSTNRFILYTNLAPNQTYSLSIQASNLAGVVNVSETFYTFSTPTVLYDCHSFTNDTIFPVGNLQAVTDGPGVWTPNALEPAVITDIGDPQGKVLQRQNTGASRADYLDFPPVSSGTLTVEFDAAESTTLGRTLDLCLQQPGSTATAMASFLAWGDTAGKISYFDNVNWIPFTDFQNDWHHYKIINYLSGPAAGKYDLIVDGTVIAQRLPWRNLAPGAILGRLRIQSQNTNPIFEYSELDNIVITAGPTDYTATLGPTVTVLAPVNHSILQTPVNVQFQVDSGSALYSTNVGLTINGAQVSATITNSTANQVFVTYTAATNGNYVAVVSATNGVGVSTGTDSFIATDESWLYDPSSGWAGPWQWSAGQPQLMTDNPLDGSSSYLRLDVTNALTRNLIRQYQNATVDITQPHYISWKTRLSDENFASDFISFGDRMHFFARTAANLPGGTDANNSWAISATGAEQTPGSGISAGQYFYIFDNLDGTGAYNLTNLVNSGIQVQPDHVYYFKLLVSPYTKTYSAIIVDETSSLTFTSSVPHHFRNVTATSFPYLHFGVETTPSTDPRRIDLDSVTITQAAIPVVLTNAIRGGSTFSFSFTSQSGSSHTAQYVTNITSGIWTDLYTIPGDGTSKTIIHTNPPAAPVYYRVRTVQP